MPLVLSLRHLINTGRSYSSTQRGASLFRYAAVWPLAILTALAIVIGSNNFAQAQTTEKGDTSDASRNQCLQAIPRQQISQRNWAKLQPVLNRPSLYRRMPIQVISTDSDMFLFLLRYPEVVTNIWELMGVANIKISRTSPTTFHAVDSGGSETNVELIHASETMHIWYGEGNYRGPVLKRKIQGRCVGVLHSGFSRGPEGANYATARLDVFLTIDDIGGDIMARSLGPVVGSTTDANFAEAAHFVSRVSQISAENGPGVEGLAQKLTRVQPPVRNYFGQLAATVHHRAQLREARMPVQVAPTAPPQ